MISRLLTFVLASLFSVAVVAGDKGEEEKQQAAATESDELPAFAEADTNGDGSLSWDEAKAIGISKDAFDRGDFDDNGEVSETIYEYSLKS